MAVPTGAQLVRSLGQLFLFVCLAESTRNSWLCGLFLCFRVSSPSLWILGSEFVRKTADSSLPLFSPWLQQPFLKVSVALACDFKHLALTWRNKGCCQIDSPVCSNVLPKQEDDQFFSRPSPANMEDGQGSERTPKCWEGNPRLETPAWHWDLSAEFQELPVPRPGWSSEGLEPAPRALP